MRPVRDNPGMTIRAISPDDVASWLAEGAVFIDVREDHERARGQAAGARGVAKAQLLAEPDRHLADRDAPVVLICQMGGRSMDAARALEAAGYTRLASVEGGTQRWQDEGRPMVRPDMSAETIDFNERYSRHLLLPEVGVEGQRRLEGSRVLMIGAGGLGSPAAFYLAAAGVGHLRIADDDVVDRSNLQRQILHTEARIGEPKVASAQATLGALNPRTQVEAVQVRVTSDNIERLLDGVDVVLDGADNFPVRYLLNDACVKLGIPLVYGAVQRFEGQVSVFDAGRHRGELPCYRCLFPEPPPPEFAPNCAEAGVLGVLPGLVGMLQATETLKLLLGIGTPLLGTLLCVDALGMQFDRIPLGRDPDCPACGKNAAGNTCTDLPDACAAPPG